MGLGRIIYKLKGIGDLSRSSTCRYLLFSCSHLVSMGCRSLGAGAAMQAETAHPLHPKP